MQVSVEKTKGLERKVTVQLPAEQFESACSERLRSIAKTARLDGFRPGKVPHNVVQKKYGESVRHEVLNDLIKNTYGKAIDEKQLKPAGLPQIDSQPPLAGQDVKYTATFEVFPEFELGDLSKIKITKPQVEIAAKDIEDTLARLRKQRAEWVEVDRAAKTGDQVKIDFQGTIDGEAFEGGEGKDVPLELGSGQMIEGFESQLEGIKAGEQRDLKIKFPKDYHAEPLRGKKAVFACQCKLVMEQKLPEMDEEFVKACGIEDGKMESLRDKIREHVNLESEQRVRSYMREQAMEGLIAQHKIDLPNIMIDGEIESLRQQTAKRLGLKEVDIDKLPRDGFEERARQRVHLALVLTKLTQEKEIKPDQDRVKTLVEQAVAQYPNADQMVQYYMSNPQALRHFQSMAVEDQAVDLVLEAAKTSDKKMSFEELINLKAS
ncbi:MAG: trigger factor [Gammaproteobacteria bacterium]|nr:trigger factor [Gammaproteobacteria bacterium]